MTAAVPWGTAGFLEAPPRAQIGWQAMFSWIGDHFVGLLLFAGAIVIGWKGLGWLSKRSDGRGRAAPVTIFCNKCGWKGAMGKTKRACNRCGSLSITLRTT